ncbi:cobalamin biosynthesis protein [Rhodococcus sp. D2-41]|uniref:Cobalamin biosynthesis protein CobD n=1 Tax=Speluncibacter jeojiensis TaxID=2710754 RepID=A0A9X4LVZ7_9ACTN|nr:cobalamin biosynthesis protein [Rhodococcus sp. D2-41]MDG3011897.1 cobalamin biosynthesis protein [Rhodococcus sp. D2-41]MDG3013348.1 cobalamin biosynthesis protein [Corynebacteriales bacterium D3-21]
MTAARRDLDPRRPSGGRGRGLGRAAGLLLGFAADRLWADPRRGHPVAGFGRIAMAAEARGYRDHRLAGVVHVAVLVGGTAGAGAVAARLLRRRGRVWEILGTAAATWTVLGGTTLAATGRQMAEHLSGGDLASARALLPSLCGRDPNLLDADGLARAAVESVAENTADAAVAPLLWGAVAGVPGLLGYRAVNTLDAMIGYRSPRHLRFGWAAARLDDVANLLPARLCGALTVASAPVVGGDPAEAWSAWCRDAAGHPSPNAGVVEASAAGALGVALGGLTEYAHGAELRPTLGAGPRPAIADLARAARLSTAVQYGAAAVSAAVAVAVGQFGLRRRQRGRVGV